MHTKGRNLTWKVGSTRHYVQLPSYWLSQCALGICYGGLDSSLKYGRRSDLRVATSSVLLGTGVREQTKLLKGCREIVQSSKFLQQRHREIYDDRPSCPAALNILQQAPSLPLSFGNEALL